MSGNHTKKSNNASKLKSSLKKGIEKDNKLKEDFQDIVTTIDKSSTDIINETNSFVIVESEKSVICVSFNCMSLYTKLYVFIFI